MMQKKEIFLQDYKAPSYSVLSLNLEFEITNDFTQVTSKAKYQKLNSHSESLRLDGLNLELKEIKLNGKTLADSDYQLAQLSLTIFSPPQEFELEIITLTDPAKNHSGEGLYQSGEILCTQCEAEGFRRITYFMDRPDVMTKYTTKIIADKKCFPVLLSNGNKIDHGDLDNGKHFVVWEDPFKKPCYLFALVAGDLALEKGLFTTRSRRDVQLEVYVDPGNEDKCQHAIESLKKSMKWDEDTFGLEYDLDIYMIVAVDSFNMGAMENKGLNIFNSAYVLAKKETATDDDYMGIEAVIGHEYFHNWTGNRVTCRDWFQLTLKEGLTVFRDQEFSSDMLSRSVKRIEDVIGLKNHQFVEDAGTLSPPIKPKSFVEINNFYTSTIYEKGAEVIRMIHTLLGQENFRKGMDLYFERFDGMAVTTEDFVASMSEASGINLEQFKAWYDQNGTPLVKVETDFNIETKTFTVNFVQESKMNNDQYAGLQIPLKYTLYDTKGEALGACELFILDKKKQTFTLQNMAKEPVLSINENFSAPVDIEQSLKFEDKVLLAKYCKDYYSRYNAIQNVFNEEIKSLTKMYHDGNELKVGHEVKSVFKHLLQDTVDLSFKTMALKIPTLKEVNTRLSQFEFTATDAAITELKLALVQHCEVEMLELLSYEIFEKEYTYDASSIAQRSFSLFLVEMLYMLESKVFQEKIQALFLNAKNMTVEYSLLSTISKSNDSFSQMANESFYQKWSKETLVIQKWLNIQASNKLADVSKMKELEMLAVYDNKIPNLVRALIGVFVRANFIQFHKEDGSGYQFVGEKIIEIDKFNPQIAAGICRALNFKSKLDEKRKKLFIDVLNGILNTEGISSDVSEVVNKNLT